MDASQPTSPKVTSNAAVHLSPTWPPEMLSDMPHTLHEHLDQLAQTMPPPEADIIWVRKWVSAAAHFRYASPSHHVSWTGSDLHRVKLDYMIGYLVECGLGLFHATEIALDIVDARKRRSQWRQALADTDSAPNAKKSPEQTRHRGNGPSSNINRTPWSRVSYVLLGCLIRVADLCMAVALVWSIFSILFPTKSDDVFSEYSNMLRLHFTRE